MFVRLIEVFPMTLFPVMVVTMCVVIPSFGSSLESFTQHLRNVHLTMTSSASVAQLCEIGTSVVLQCLKRVTNPNGVYTASLRGQP